MSKNKTKPDSVLEPYPKEVKKCTVEFYLIDGKTKIKVDCSKLEFFGMAKEMFSHLMLVTIEIWDYLLNDLLPFIEYGKSVALQK